MAEAHHINGAVNVSGLVKALDRVLSEDIWPMARERGHGTEWVNRHPAVILFLEKINDLSEFTYSRADRARAYKPPTAVTELDDAVSLLREDGE